jgi:hypothetical protein
MFKVRSGVTFGILFLFCIANSCFDKTKCNLKIMSRDEVFDMFKNGSFPPSDLPIRSINGDLFNRDELKNFDNEKYDFAHVKDCNNTIKYLQIVKITSDDLKARKRLDSLFSSNIDLHIKLVKFREKDTAIANQIIKQIRTRVIVLDTTIDCEHFFVELQDAFDKDQASRSLTNFNVNDDLKNLAVLESITSKCGWEAIEKAGKESLYHAFIIVQHAQPKYRIKYFPLFKGSMNKGLIEKSIIALMIDRILIDSNKKQIYGTQFTIDNQSGEKILEPIENPEKIDSIRSTVGLGTISDYLKIVNK